MTAPVVLVSGAGGGIGAQLNARLGGAGDQVFFSDLPKAVQDEVKEHLAHGHTDLGT